MQPEQPTPPPQQNPYDFFMNPQTAPKPQKKFGLPPGISKTQRVVIIVGGLFLLIVIGLVLATVFTAGEKSQSEQLFSLAQEQAEIIRVAGLAEEKSAIHTSSTTVLATNTSLSLASSQKQLLALTKKAKASEKELAQTTNTKTDQTLTNAEQNHNYDKVFATVIKDELKTYQAHVKKVYDSAKSKPVKQALQSAYNDASVLLGE